MSAAVGALPRLLESWRPGGAQSLADHDREHGAVDLRPDRESLLRSVEASGLRGRGGAGFPTGRKLRAVAAGRRPVVVVNGAEGEPASVKDRLLLEGMPHLVLDGAVLSAVAVGAREAIVCAEAGSGQALSALARAVDERERARRDPIRLRIEAVADRYVSGEESALVNQLNGGPPLPTFVPPRPFERGVRGRPTLIQNVETLAHLALIARSGEDWFREVGAPHDPGSALVTVSGAVDAPGVYEVACGSTVSELLADAAPSAPPRAVLLGGYFGTWVPSAWLGAVPLDHDGDPRLPTSLGCGVVGVLPQGACGWCQTARLLDYLASQSAGQCGPCTFGLRAIADTATRLGRGMGGPADLERLDRWAGDVEGRGACRHPDGAVRLLRSALDAFADDAERHASGRACPPRGSWLPLGRPERMAGSTRAA